MIMPLLDDVAARLEADGMGTVKTAANNPATWPIFKGGMFEGSTADAIALAEYADAGPVDEMGSTVGLVVAEQVGLQVRVRHGDYAAARARAEAIWGKLHKLGNVTLGTTRYLLVEAKQSPFLVGRDPSNRWLLGFNVKVTKERG